VAALTILRFFPASLVSIRTIRLVGMYYCGVSADRSRPEELAVEGIEVPLTTDEHFDAFESSCEKGNGIARSR